MTENLEKVVFLRYSGLLPCFLNFTMGGVWTLAGALPIFNKINYRRGCFMKKSFQRVIAPRSLSLPKGRLITIFLLAAFFALSACDDSSSASSNGPDENAAAESSSSLKDSDTAEDLSSSIDKAQESSSSMKYSSSEDKNSSSSVEKSNSSSSYVADYCKEGDIDTLYQEKRTVYVHCDGGYWKTDSIVYVKPMVYPVMDSLFETKHSVFTDKT